MTKAELIKALRYCGNSRKTGCKGCPLWDKPMDACFQIVTAAADALEAADKRIAKLEAQLPKEGERIEEDGLEGAIKGRVFCSNCKNLFQSIVITNEKIILTNQKTKYCPNCGAKMEEGKRQ